MPDTFPWVEVVGLLASIATASFAGIGVYLLLLERRSRVAAEFDFKLRSPQNGGGEKPWEPNTEAPESLYITVTVTNRLEREIRIVGMRAAGVPLLFSDVYDPRRVRRYRDGIKRDADVPVAANRSAELGLGVELDWLACQARDLDPGRSLRLSSSVIIDSNRWLRRTFSRTASMAISAEIIEKNAAKAVQK